MTSSRQVVGVAIPVVLAVTLAVMVLTRGGDAGESNRANGPPPNTSASPAESPTPEPRPKLQTKGSDFERIWSAIDDFRTWLYAHPDPSLLDRIYSPQCGCYEPERKALANLAEKDQHYEGPEGSTISVRVIERLRRDLVRLEVVDEQPASEIVDADGEVVERTEGWPPTKWHFFLTRGNDGRWRLSAAGKLGRVK